MRGQSAVTRPWHWGVDNDSSLTILALTRPNPHTASLTGHVYKMTHQKVPNDLETQDFAASIALFLGCITALSQYKENETTKNIKPQDHFHFQAFKEAKLIVGPGSEGPAVAGAVGVKRLNNSKFQVAISQRSPALHWLRAVQLFNARRIFVNITFLWWWDIEHKFCNYHVDDCIEKISKADQSFGW